MKWPIAFQPLEGKLAPVLKYLAGRVLNAGCGSRDMTSFLTAHGAVSVENCDLKSPIPGAMECDLTRVPQPDGTYDAILCNAVLEHVPDVDAVIAELHCLLKPGGHLVLGVPFLQPFHADPGDYRRFTGDGLRRLGERSGFEVVDVLPAHSVAQVVSWIVWNCLCETGNRIGQWVLWLPFYVWNRLSNKTDFRLKQNASGYQAVFRKKAS